jgi:7-carboxy-7-deazaguanine synthase
MEPRLRVNEIFYSLQGESTHAGRPCVFVRLTGCPLRCTYCDSEYAFYDGRWMGLDAVLAAVAAHPCRLVEVTGGEPLAQPAAPALLAALLARGHEVLLETSGAQSIEPVPAGVHVVLDLKTPDSGECARNLWTNLPRLRPGDEVKFVIASRGDYEWTRDVVAGGAIPAHAAVLVSPVWESGVARDLAEWILADGLRVRYQMQLHKWVWPGVERGV